MFVLFFVWSVSESVSASNIRPDEGSVSRILQLEQQNNALLSKVNGSFSVVFATLVKRNFHCRSCCLSQIGDVAFSPDVHFFCCVDGCTKYIALSVVVINSNQNVAFLAHPSSVV